MNTAHYPRYEHYKDSGTDWLGEIPSDWELIPNKYIFRLKNKKVGKKSNEYDLLSLTLKGVIKRDMENPEGKFPAEFDTYQEVKKGDFIFCMFDVQETPRTVGLSTFNGMITGAYTVFDVAEKFNRKFLYYFYLNLDTDKRLKPLYRGLRNTIPKEWFLSFKTFIPPLAEQTAIADFLDQKTAQIDQAIALKQAQIDKLNEYKQIIIQKAVTHGLNPNVPMKNSGVDWIGDIPEHWEVKKLKFVVNKIGDIDHYMPETIDDGVPYAMTGDLQELSSKINFTACKKISYKDYLTLSRKIKPQKGDVIFARYATIGTVCYVDRHTDFLISYSCLTIKPNLKDILGLFLFYYLKSNSFFCGIQSKINSNTQGNVGVESLKNIHVSLPPINEQQEIVAHIERMNEQIHQTMTNYQTQIDRLKEYRHILINQAVTGKIKVC